MSVMSHRDRVLAALEHKEPDRIPFDLGSNSCTGIHRIAYAGLREGLGLPQSGVKIAFLFGQLAAIDDDVMQTLDIDAKGPNLAPNAPTSYAERQWEDAQYSYADDKWGVVRRMSKETRLYYDFYAHPLAGASLEDVERYPWPDMTDRALIAGLQERIDALHMGGYPSQMGGVLAGPLWALQALQGYYDCYINLATNHTITEHILARTLQMELDFWDLCAQHLKTWPDVVLKGDDLAGKDTLLVQPAIIERLFRPYYQAIFSRIKHYAPRTKILFHCCGAMRELIPMLIEVGVDVINPLQVSARGMNDTKKLKQDFGSDIGFWGGGVDTQRVLNHGTPQEVRDEVRRRIDDLAPGGGFVFAAVHSIEPDVPPQNVIAMWEAFQEYGRY